MRWKFVSKEASSREKGKVKSAYSDSRAKRRSLPLVKITYVSREQRKEELEGGGDRK